jgi:Type IV secretory pathway, component VirB8
MGIFTKKNKTKPVTTAPVKKPSSKQDEYFGEAISWETERFLEERKSKKLAWRIAGFSLAISLASVLAVAALSPLKTVEPFVVRVDNSTGMVDIVTALTTEKTNYEEAINKYFIAKYVINRESYSPQARNHMYNVVGLMSDSSVASQYAEYYNPRYNPEAPLKIFGDSATVTVDLKNISFVDKQVALIRFTKTVRRGPDKVVSHWIATLTFTYVSGQMAADDRLVNPLGFQCTDYRLDPETIGGSK